MAMSRKRKETEESFGNDKTMEVLKEMGWKLSSRPKLENDKDASVPVEESKAPRPVGPPPKRGSIGGGPLPPAGRSSTTVTTITTSAGPIPPTTTGPIPPTGPPPSQNPVHPIPPQGPTPPSGPPPSNSSSSVPSSSQVKPPPPVPLALIKRRDSVSINPALLLPKPASPDRETRKRANTIAVTPQTPETPQPPLTHQTLTSPPSHHVQALNLVSKIGKPITGGIPMSGGIGDGSKPAPNWLEELKLKKMQKPGAPAPPTTTVPSSTPIINTSPADITSPPSLSTPTSANTNHSSLVSTPPTITTGPVVTPSIKTDSPAEPPVSQTQTQIRSQPLTRLQLPRSSIIQNKPTPPTTTDVSGPRPPPTSSSTGPHPPSNPPSSHPPSGPHPPSVGLPPSVGPPPSVGLPSGPHPPSGPPPTMSNGTTTMTVGPPRGPPPPRVNNQPHPPSSAPPPLVFSSPTLPLAATVSPSISINITSSISPEFQHSPSKNRRLTMEHRPMDYSSEEMGTPSTPTKRSLESPMPPPPQCESPLPPPPPERTPPPTPPPPPPPSSCVTPGLPPPPSPTLASPLGHLKLQSGQKSKSNIRRDVNPFSGPLFAEDEDEKISIPKEDKLPPTSGAPAFRPPFMAAGWKDPTQKSKGGKRDSVKEKNVNGGGPPPPAPAPVASGKRKDMK